MPMGTPGLLLLVERFQEPDQILEKNSAEDADINGKYRHNIVVQTSKLLEL